MLLQERLIKRYLRCLDPQLFLATSRDDSGEEFPAIWYDAYPPIAVQVWKYPDGRPRPLSLDLVHAVYLNEGSIGEAIYSVKRNNWEIRKAAARAALSDLQTITEEFNKSAKKLHWSGPWSPGKDVTAWK